MIKLEKREDLERDFSNTECKIMVNILNFISNNDYNLLTSSELARQINLNPTHKYFQKIFNYLKSLNIIEITSTIGNMKILKINKRLLKDFIDEQHELNWWMENFWKPHHKNNW